MTLSKVVLWIGTGAFDAIGLWFLLGGLGIPTNQRIIAAIVIGVVMELRRR